MLSQREELLNWDKREKKSKIYFIWGKESMNEKVTNKKLCQKRWTQRAIGKSLGGKLIMLCQQLFITCRRSDILLNSPMLCSCNGLFAFL